MIKRTFNEPQPHNKLRLHSSERNSTWGKVFDEFKNELSESDIKFYPNVNELNESITKFYGGQNFLIGFGSDRCIKYFFEGNRAKNLIITNPCFPMYKVYGQMFNLNIIEVPYKTLEFPIDEFIRKIKRNSIVVISNPSSPVGDIISESNLERILELGLPTLIDEAYIEFSSENSFISKIEKYPNLYVIRTFSKALGSAGVRFGTIFSNKNNIEILSQYRDMYETSGLTLKWIKVLLKNLDVYENYVKEVKMNRQVLINSFIKLGYEVIPSNSNWIYIKDFKHLPKNTIFKNDCSLPELGNNWLRLQITDNLNDYICLLKSKEIVDID